MATASNICEIVKSKLNYRGRPELGLLESLVSRMNIQASDFSPVASVPGKKKTMLVRYTQPSDYTDVTSGSIAAGLPGYCEGEEFTYLEEQYEIDNYVRITKKVSDLEMSAFCEDKGTVASDMINSMITGLLTKIDIDLIALFEATRGNTSAGNTTPISGLAFSDLANGITSPQIMEVIDSEYAALSASNLQRIIVGGTLLRQYQNATGIGCCNINGQQTDQFIGTNATYFDQYMNASTLGASPANNDWFVYPAGLVQFLDWSLVADNSTFGNSGSEMNTVLNVQVGEDTFFPIDLKIVRSSCDSFWYVTLEKFFGLMTFPLDYFANAPLADVNYMLRFRPTTV